MPCASADHKKRLHILGIEHNSLLPIFHKEAGIFPMSVSSVDLTGTYKSWPMNIPTAARNQKATQGKRYTQH
jgi:hypothetical protein